MEDNDLKYYMDKVFCLICNEIKKIIIYSSWENKTIDLSFECNHERKKQDNQKNYDFCFNCRKKAEQDKNCVKQNHKIIKSDELLFYCKTHLKKYNAYCDICKQNLCDECDCNHKDIKSNYEFYFSLSQIEELLNTFDEAQHFIRMIYSLDCNDKISQEFENYYNIYNFIYNNELFHINIIYNINFLYNFFRYLTNNKLIIDGYFRIFEINNIIDNTIFFDSNIKRQFNEFMDVKSFNFKNVLNLFLLSKRFPKKTELYEEFSNIIYHLIVKKTLKLDNIEKNINKFNEYLNIFKEGKFKKELEILNIQKEIDFEILSIKLSKIAIPSSLKRKLITILQREIINKFSEHLHKIKLNSFILNNIKKRYEALQKQDIQLFNSLNLGQKYNEIIKLQLPPDNTIDNVYFESEFDLKNLLNTFIYFTQKLHYQKSNETHYSNEKKVNPLNQLITGFQNKNGNVYMNIEINKNSINTANSLDHESNNNPNTQQNSVILTNQNENNNSQIMKYKHFLNHVKNDFENSYKDILIKDKLNLENIFDALFKNDFTNIIKINDNNKDTEMNSLINSCLDELNNIKCEKDENQKKLEEIYSQIVSNKFQNEREIIVTTLSADRKYKNLMKKIKENYGRNKTFENPLYEELIQLLIQSGGFDEKNSDQIIEIIENYLYYSNEIIDLNEKIEKYINSAKENSELDCEIKQLLKIKSYIIEVNNKLKDYSNNFEHNEMSTIKDSFEKKADIYISNSTDTSFQNALKGIRSFVKGKNIETILAPLRNVFKDIESNFYVDESLDLTSFCWGIQNGHDSIVKL